MMTSADVNSSIDLAGGNSKGRRCEGTKSCSLPPVEVGDSEGQYHPKVARAGRKGGKKGRIHSSPQWLFGRASKEPLVELKAILNLSQRACGRMTVETPTVCARVKCLMV